MSFYTKWMLALFSEHFNFLHGNTRQSELVGLCQRLDSIAESSAQECTEGACFI